MAPLVNSVVTYIFGGWDLGVCADLILQGAVFAQFAHYNSLYSSDVLYIRLFVYVLMIITTLKSVQGLSILWQQNVTYFTDFASAVGMYSTAWTERDNLALAASIAFYVQMFFATRLWAISRNIFVVGVVSILFVFALVAAFVSSGLGPRVPSSAYWIAIHLGTVFAGDALLCGFITFFLTRTSKRALPQTAGMLSAIVKLTFQSAAPAAICAMINLICSQTGARFLYPTVWPMLAIITNQALPKLYAISAMWTLNSRRDIRTARSTGHGQTTSSGDGGGVSGGRAGRRTNVELGMLSGTGAGRNMAIQVRTQVQTMQHADEMFAGKGPQADELSLDTDTERVKGG